MKNRILTSTVALAALFSACKKDNTTTTPTNSNTNNNSSPYYFKFNFDDTAYNLNANFPQYMVLNYDIVGGYQVDKANFYHSVGLSFQWPAGHTITDSDVKGLAGKTFYFVDQATDSTIRPMLEYDRDLQSGSWFEYDTSNVNYYVKVTDVTFLKKDTSLGHPLDVYVISGTCRSILEQNYTLKEFTNGDFKFVISRNDM